jgi:hypothetical protein
MTADRFHADTQRRLLEMNRPIAFKPFRLPELRAAALRTLLVADHHAAAQSAAA